MRYYGRRKTQFSQLCIEPTAPGKSICTFYVDSLQEQNKMTGSPPHNYIFLFPLWKAKPAFCSFDNGLQSCHCPHSNVPASIDRTHETSFHNIHGRIIWLSLIIIVSRLGLRTYRFTGHINMITLTYLWLIYCSNGCLYIPFPPRNIIDFLMTFFFSLFVT